MNRLRLGLGLGPRAASVVVCLAVLAMVQLPAVWAATTAGMTSSSETLAPGLEHFELRSVAGDLAVHVARLAPGGPVEVQAVLAGGAAASAPPGRETTSAMCGRVGGTVCVNADFASCTSCREALGGFASAGVIRRSFHPHHEQFTLTTDGFTLERLQWRAELRATYRWPAEPDPSPSDLLAQPPPSREAREEVRVLVIDGLNRGDEGGTLLLTSDWGAATTVVADRLELLLALDAEVPSRRHAVDLHGIRDGGNRLQPGQAVVRGPAPPMQSFWDEWNSTDSPHKHLELGIISSERVVESIGGHPILLRDGRRTSLDQADPKVSERHPRSIVGWTAEKELLLVTIDGRRPGWSRGATLAEATDLLVDLGATDALNLDGGGSTTFVAPCAGGLCARNRPSDGTERKVPVVLALLVEQGAVQAHEQRQAQAPTPADQHPRATVDPPRRATAEAAPAMPTPADVPPADPESPAPEAAPAMTPPPLDPASGSEDGTATNQTRPDVAPAEAISLDTSQTALAGDPAPVPDEEPSVPPALMALALSWLAGVAVAAVRALRGPAS